MNISLINNNINNEDICLVDSATTHTILKDTKYFSYLLMQEANVSTISGSTNLIEGSGRATLLLDGGTQLYIDDALYYSESQRNLLSFKDIRRNGYHVETTNEENVEYLYITCKISDKKMHIRKIIYVILRFVLHIY